MLARCLPSQEKEGAANLAFTHKIQVNSVNRWRSIPVFIRSHCPVGPTLPLSLARRFQ